MEQAKGTVLKNASMKWKKLSRPEDKCQRNKGEESVWGQRP